jgi:hypothetical protein
MTEDFIFNDIQWAFLIRVICDSRFTLY